MMDGGQTYADWVAVDWGTSNMRAWAMSSDGQVLGEVRSDKGMGTLQPHEFEPVLNEVLQNWIGSRTLPVVACGMVGSRQGWVEAPYATVPCPPVGTSGVTAPTTDPRLNVRIIPGLCQTPPADVMRGEEVQIAGFLAGNAEFDGVICLPGTHTKWVHISAGEIVSFQTFMTGELFSLLSTKSILRHSVAADSWDSVAFLEGIEDAMSRPQSVASQLFGLRAGSLIADLSPATARSRLSGLLIGIELAAARPYWLGRNVAFIGADELAGLYVDALIKQGLNTSKADTQTMTLLGLAAAKNSLKEHAN